MKVKKTIQIHSQGHTATTSTSRIWLYSNCCMAKGNGKSCQHKCKLDNITVIDIDYFDEIGSFKHLVMQATTFLVKMKRFEIVEILLCLFVTGTMMLVIVIVCTILKQNRYRKQEM